MTDERIRPVSHLLFQGAATMERRMLALLAVLLLLGAPLEARTRKGDRYLKDGMAAESQKLYDEALADYENAVAQDPADTEYLLHMRRTRFRASETHLNAGQGLRKEGKLEAALEEFRKAFGIDPASLAAEQEMRRTLEMMERERKLAEKAGGKQRPDQERALTPVQESRKESQVRISGMMPAPELKPISRQITTLKMNNQPPKVLFETVGKLAGVNVIFDPDYSTMGAAKPASVDLTNVTLEEALDHLSVLTKSFWKPLSTNTILVSQEQPQKRRDYDDFVVKTFYLTNVMTVQELQEITTAVRAVTDIRRMFTYNAQNAILVRGTVDQVNLAEKLIQDLDKPKGEVVLDVIVMEVNRTNSKTLGGSITSGTTNGLSIGISPNTSSTTTSSSTSASTTSTTTSTTLLADLLKLGSRDFAMTLPGYSLSAVMSDSTSKIVQSPQVRAIDNIKASLKIGDRVPTASGSYSAGVGAVGTNALVNTQFQYIDVGVNVDVTAKIHSWDEVSLHIELEISTVRNYVDIGGISQPVIGQRKVAHDLRMREGQVTLLGGIMTDSDTTTTSGTPGLANIPLLKYLFSSKEHDISKQELVIALIPHIVRAPDISAQNLRGVAAGNDQTVRLTYGSTIETGPRGVPATPTAGVAAPIPMPMPGVPSMLLAPPSTMPAMPMPMPKPAAPASTPAPPPAPPPAAQAVPGVMFNTPAVTLPVDGTTTVTLEARQMSDLFSAPVKFHYDPAVVRIEEIQQGNLLSKGGTQQVIFTRNIQNGKGEASVNLNRIPGSGGTNGSGTLLIIRLKAVGAGTAMLTPEAPLRNSQLQPITAAPATGLQVTVR